MRKATGDEGDYQVAVLDQEFTVVKSGVVPNEAKVKEWRMGDETPIDGSGAHIRFSYHHHHLFHHLHLFRGRRVLAANDTW